MLSPADDFLLHQIAETFDHVGTSDRNFYDRYYFNLHNCSDELFLVTGMGQYPNLGTTDAFTTVSIGNTQYVVRASRELGADRLNTTIGPFSVAVLEGLRRMRVVLEPNEWGVDFDLTWEGAVPPVEEPRMTTRSFARIITDTSRLTQTGGWSGTLNVAGRRYEVTPDRWWGSRDHSWGVRPVGEPEHPGIRARLQQGGRLWSWAPMQFADFTIFYIAAEDEAGNRSLEEAARVYPYGSDREDEHLGSPRHELTFKSGTREVKHGTIVIPNPSGGELTIAMTGLRTVHLSAGTGYGRDPDWVHGMYQGELKVQGLTYDLTNPDVVRGMRGLNEMLARFELDGRVGYGLFEHVISGINHRYGFKSATDLAP